MRRLAAIFLTLFLPAATANEVYFIALEDFKKWPPIAQQAYILGSIEQGLVAASEIYPVQYRRLVTCMENVNTEAMFTYVQKHIVNYKYSEALTVLVGDGLVDYCQSQGYQIND